MAVNPERREAERARVAARWNRAAPTRPAEQVEESEEWVVSYMDMVTVLMTVFLGMLAILGMDGRLSVAGDTAQAATETREQMPEPGNEPAAHPAIPLSPGPPASAVAITGNAPDPAPTRPSVAPQPPQPALSPAARQWLARLEALGLPPEIDISSSDRKVTIVVRDRILFASGSATLEPAAQDLLRRLVPSLASLPGTITVEGHSDDTAISTARFPSNWELSAARAAAVVRTLAAMGIPPGRLGALGFADSRPVTEDPARRAENRRVEIVVDTDAATAQAAVR